MMTDRGGRRLYQNGCNNGLASLLISVWVFILFGKANSKDVPKLENVAWKKGSYSADKSSHLQLRGEWTMQFHSHPHVGTAVFLWLIRLPFEVPCFSPAGSQKYTTIIKFASCFRSYRPTVGQVAYNFMLPMAWFLAAFLIYQNGLHKIKSSQFQMIQRAVVLFGAFLLLKNAGNHHLIEWLTAPLK